MIYRADIKKYSWTFCLLWTGEFSMILQFLLFLISMLSVLLAGNNSRNSSDFAICFLKRCQSVWQDRKTTNCAFRPKIRELQICCKQFVTLCAHRFQLACPLIQKLFRPAAPIPAHIWQVFDTYHTEEYPIYAQYGINAHGRNILKINKRKG